MLPGDPKAGPPQGEPNDTSGNNADILIVDDDQQLRDLVSSMLRAEGFRVASVGSGRELLASLKIARFDLIILDVMLPGSSGFELCRQIRQFTSIPIMMLTARSEESDRVLGLEMGADDYLSKPFGSRELIARIRALLRRTALSEGREMTRGMKYRFDGWIIDTLRRELINPEGVVVDISSGEYDLLLAFVEMPQRVLTREHLLEMARNRAVVPGFDRSIDVQISRLRRKMGGEDADVIIKTVRGVGYLFVPSVTKVGGSDTMP